MKAIGLFSILCGLLCEAQTITPLSERAEYISSPALSPDGMTLAYNGPGVAIDVRPLSGGKPVYFAGQLEDGTPFGPRWSPDGKKIAYLRFYCHSCNHKLFVKDYPNGREKLLGEVCGGTPSWTPDGRFLIATEIAGGDPGWDPCRLILIPLDGGKRVRLAKEGDELAITADGKRLPYAAGNTIKTVDLDANYFFAGTPVEIAKEPHEISALHWSADGSTLVYQVWNHTKAITGGVARLVQTGIPISISQILADGSVLGTEGRAASTLWRVDLKATPLEPKKVRTIPWTDDNLSVSPDAQRLAFVTNRNGPTQIWISRLDGNQSRVLVPAIPPFERYGDRTGVDGISWSPDGKWIAIGTQPGIGHGDSRGRMFIVPSAGGRLRKLMDCGATGRAPLWTEDGKALYTMNFSEGHKGSHFLADIATGRLTPIAEEKVPKLPPVPLPSGSRQPHVAEGGRYLYYEDPMNWKSRLVKVTGLIP